MTGAPGAPSPNLAAAAAGPTPGGKASADYSSWGQFNYNQMSGENSAAAAAAAAFNHGRGYNDGGTPGPAPTHQGAARYGSEDVIGQEGGDPHTNGRPSPSNAQPFPYVPL